MLICPKCKAKLLKKEKSYLCKNGHCFDIAKQGYTHLLIHKQKATGDNKEMVQARSLFLEAGHYHFLIQQLLAILNDLSASVIVDAGCGEGYYTQEFPAKCQEVYAFDMSKYALMKCAKRSSKIHCFVASIFDLPLEDACCDVVMSIFAPFAENEFARILHDHGYVIKVEPGKRHLYEMKQMIYEHVIENEENAVNYTQFELKKEWLIENQITLHGKEEIKALFQMTPYYYRSPKEGVQRLLCNDELTTTAQFHIELYQKRSLPQ